eukprot:5736388-Prymnesium_polylepis.1
MLISTRRTPLVWAAHPLRLSQAALRKPVAGGKPVNIVQNLASDLIDGGAEPHYDTDDARDRAGRRAMCSWCCEERARAPRTA